MYKQGFRDYYISEKLKRAIPSIILSIALIMGVCYPFGAKDLSFADNPAQEQSATVVEEQSATNQPTSQQDAESTIEQQTTDPQSTEQQATEQQTTEPGADNNGDAAEESVDPGDNNDPVADSGDANNPDENNEESGDADGEGDEPNSGEEKLALLFTNDVHANIDYHEKDPNNTKDYDRIGYAYFAGLVDKYKNDDTDEYIGVQVASVGDDISGGPIYGTFTHGEAVSNLIKNVPYDVVTPGNHEFDYGIGRLDELAGIVSDDDTDRKVISCNFMDINDGVKTQHFAPYKIVETQGKKVAYIGISTPESLTKSSPKNFVDENWSYKYDFCQGGNGQELYAMVQNTVDSLPSDIDLVVALGHTGESSDITTCWTTQEIIRNTKGIDLYLDGHSHHYVNEKAKNKENKDIPYFQNGYQFSNIGLVDVTFKEGQEDPEISYHLKSRQDVVNEWTQSDWESNLKYKEVKVLENQSKNAADEAFSEEIGSTEVTLAKTDKKFQEIPLGNFCTDAYKYVYDADCAMINCGGLRSAIQGPASGVATKPVTRKDMLNANSFENELVMIKTKGKNIQDALEFGARKMMKGWTTEVNNDPEIGASPLYDVSGISYKVNLNVVNPNAVIDPKTGTSDNWSYINPDTCEVPEGCPRRVYDVQINDEPINLEKEYTIAGACYVLTDQGEGIKTFSRGDTTLVPLSGDTGMKDYEALIKYVQDGLSENKITEEMYGSAEGRIIRSDIDYCTVTYNANGGDFGTVPAPQEKPLAWDINLVSDTDLAKTGSRLVGWNTKSNPSEEGAIHYDLGAPYKDDVDITLYAEWGPQLEFNETLLGDVMQIIIDTPVANLDGSPVIPNVTVKYKLDAVDKNDTPQPQVETEESGVATNGKLLQSNFKAINNLWADSALVGNDAYAPVDEEGMTTLIAGRDYTTTFENNTQPGTAKCTVAGTNHGFTGSATVEFNIAENPNALIQASDTVAADGTTGTQTGDSTSPMALMIVLMVAGLCAGYVISRNRYAG